MNFWKYQGAGNDFIMVDQRTQAWIKREDTDKIAHYCNRRFGIGADGLILLQQMDGYDFEMVYFNADGRESSMCGNGGRCITAFAQQLGIFEKKCRFLAIDGPHEAFIQRAEDQADAWVELKMVDVPQIERLDEHAFVLNTGSPHYIRFEHSLEHKNMVEEGRAIRYNDRFKKEGINVNLVAIGTDGLQIRTYERGVEDETLACGTGITAAALAHHIYTGSRTQKEEVAVKASGGNLSVRYQDLGDGRFSDIWLCGPATAVFEGFIP